jgi:hypothetical protein
MEQIDQSSLELHLVAAPFSVYEQSQPASLSLVQFEQSYTPGRA